MKKISKIVNEEQLMQDLASYQELALALGASKAIIVNVTEIPVEERVVLKCQVPRCTYYGVSAHCPPHTLKPAELREHLMHYKWAVFFIKDVLPEVIVRDKSKLKEFVAAYKEVSEIVNKIESTAFYDGHYLAFGLSAGACKLTYCGQQETCQAMEGKGCRFPLLSRPSMEAAGIDVYKMVTQAGWDIYPIGKDAKAIDIPKGTLGGIIIIE